MAKAEPRPLPAAPCTPACPRLRANAYSRYPTGWRRVSDRGGALLEAPGVPCQCFPAGGFLVGCEDASFNSVRSPVRLLL
eukprot:6743986-Pyramimonas_sp.AAC.1